MGDFLVSAISVSLTPLESLCFEQVSFWVGVVAKNKGRSGRLVDGRPFTRLPAAELVSNLEERLPFLSVTLRQVRRALNRLVELGLLVREQLWQRERWRSDYWYSLPLAETPVKPGVAEAVPPQVQVGEHGTDEGVTLCLRNLSSTHTEQTRRTKVVSMEEQAPASRVDVRKTSHGVLCAPVGAVEPVACPLTPPSSLTGAAGSPVPSLKATVWERVQALASQFDPSAVAPVSPSVVLIGNKVHRVSDGACAPLR